METQCAGQQVMSAIRHNLTQFLCPVILKLVRKKGQDQVSPVFAGDFFVSQEISSL